jgi:hypothetical protein
MVILSVSGRIIQGINYFWTNHLVNDCNRYELNGFHQTWIKISSDTNKNFQQTNKWCLMGELSVGLWILCSRRYFMHNNFFTYKCHYLQPKQSLSSGETLQNFFIWCWLILQSSREEHIGEGLSTTILLVWLSILCPGRNYAHE